MANYSDSRELEKFDVSLINEPSLSGMDDLVGRLPRFAARRLTDCGNNRIEGFGFDDKIADTGLDRFGVKPGELNVRMSYRGAYFYWGRSKGGTSILTRVSSSHGSECLIMSDGGKALDYLLAHFQMRYMRDRSKNPKFAVGEVYGREGDAVISVRPSKPDDKVRGNFAPWWDSYWFSVMKPALALINHCKAYGKIDEAILSKDFPILSAPE